MNNYKGPQNNRKLGTVSFVEFGDQDTARDFVSAVESSGVQVQAGGKQLLVKKARTQKASSRNWALRKAEELLKATPGGAEAKLDWKEREVKVKEASLKAPSLQVASACDAKRKQSAARLPRQTCWTTRHKILPEA